MPEPEPVPFYDEYLYERTEVEMETIKTLESEPVPENPGNPDSPDPCSADPTRNPEDNPGPNPDSSSGNDNADNSSPTIAGNPASPAAESEEEPEASEEFRSQLQNVQKQLEALSSLPNTIQATIAALTEQLSALAQPKRKSKSVTPRPEGIRIVGCHVPSLIASHLHYTTYTQSLDTLAVTSRDTFDKTTHLCIFFVPCAEIANASIRRRLEMASVAETAPLQLCSLGHRSSVCVWGCEYVSA